MSASGRRSKYAFMETKANSRVGLGRRTYSAAGSPSQHSFRERASPIIDTGPIA